MNTMPSQRLPKSLGAFTVVELLVVAAVIGCLAALLAPALAKTRPNSRAIQCLSNTRRLALAWQMYAEDNAGRLVENYHGGSMLGGNAASTQSPWAQGWFDWSSTSDNTNAAFLVQERYARLASYVNHTSSLFRCPADNYVSAVQRARGWTRRVRSYSMNVGVGAGNAELGPWGPIYKHVAKNSDFIYPGPAESWVFLEEAPDSINEPAFFNPSAATSWTDFPSPAHEGGTSFSFADGHVELHRWTASMTKLGGVVGTHPTITALAGDADVHWISYHASRNSPSTY